MGKENNAVGTGVALGILASGLVLMSIALVTAYTGAYNIAATEDHTAITRWAFETTMHNSVEARAKDIAVPTPIGDAAAGATAYKAMCEHCHAGPGVHRAQWAKGMLPLPPHLVEQAAEWEPNQVFWLLKNGVKMTGMPAFGPTHEDQELWDITAFVVQLPGMTAQRYTELSNRHGGGSNGGHAH